MQSSVLREPPRRSPVTLPAYRLGVCPANAGKKYPPEVLTSDEVKRLIAACPRRGYAGPRNRALIAVLWRCGLRVAEAVALELRDVDLERSTLSVRHGKGDRARIVGVDPDAGAMLELWLNRRAELEIPRSRPIVFCVISEPTRGKAMYTSCVRETLKDAARRAGIDKRVHPHGLRHTHAAELARENVPLIVIQKALGHSSAATTQRYIDHLEPQAVIRAMQARGGWLNHDAA